MAVKVLTEKHELLKRLRKLEQTAIDLGIRLSVGRNGQIFLYDTQNGEEIQYEYRDVEQNYTSYSVTSEFPNHCETKLIYDEDENGLLN